MDKNTWIGFLLIAVIIVGFSFIGRPSKEELAERQRIQDSIALAQQQEREMQFISDQINAQLYADSVAKIQADKDSATLAQELEAKVQATYGAFAPAAKGQNTQTVIENSKVRLYVDSKGGRIARAELKEYKAYGDTLNDLCLFRADESKLSYTLITANKHQGIRAALCWDTPLAELARQHNNANVLGMPANFISEEKALDIVRTFFTTDFEGGRHERRVNKIAIH